MLNALIREIRSLDTSRKSLRSFGLVIGSILLLIAIGLLWRAEWIWLSNPLSSESTRPPAIIGMVGLALVATGAAVPRLLGPVYVAWMAIAVILGAITSRIVLATVFVLLIIPTGIVMRLMGRDPLRRRINDSSDSYWVSRADMDRSAERLEKYY